MKARIILITLIVLIVLGGTKDTFATYSQQQDSIRSLIIKAVEDEGWLEAKSQEELFEFFYLFCTKELAWQLAEDTWPFFVNPTGFLETAVVTQTKTIVLGKTAYTIAQLELFYLGLDDPQLEALGTGTFNLVLEEGQWKISQMDFVWNYLH